MVERIEEHVSFVLFMDLNNGSEEGNFCIKLAFDSEISVFSICSEIGLFGYFMLNATWYHVRDVFCELG